MAKNAVRTESVRAARPKTAAQLAKKARNEAQASSRLLRLQDIQQVETAKRNERAARKVEAMKRGAALLARAEADSKFTVWLRINRRVASPGTAALFFARNASPAPIVLPPMPRAGEVRCPINPACDCLSSVG